MKILRWVPGAIVSPNAITIPATAPNIEAVVAAEITRVPTGMCNLVNHTQAQVIAAIAVHSQADIVAALADHAVHPHDFASQGTGIAPVTPGGLDATVSILEDAGVAAPHTVPAAAATGVLNNAAAQAHGDGVTPPPHVAGGAPLVHGAGADPVVAAVPTRISTRTLSLDVNTLVGDLLTLSYREVGELALCS